MDFVSNYENFFKGNVSASGIVIGPLSYYWYTFLDKIYPKKTFISILKKILLDQLIGATLFTFLFILIVCYFDGLNLSQILDEFRNKFLFIYLVYHAYLI